MIHLRIDDEFGNDKRRFACGLGPALPEGDQYVFEAEIELFHMVNCPGCGGGPRQLGTSIGELSSQPGRPGYARFKDIARSWGHE